VGPRLADALTPPPRALNHAHLDAASALAAPFRVSEVALAQMVPLLNRLRLLSSISIINLHTTCASPTSNMCIIYLQHVHHAFTHNVCIRNLHTTCASCIYSHHVHPQLAHNRCIRINAQPGSQAPEACPDGRIWKDMHILPGLWVRVAALQLLTRHIAPPMSQLCNPACSHCVAQGGMLLCATAGDALTTHRNPRLVYGYAGPLTWQLQVMAAGLIRVRPCPPQKNTHTQTSFPSGPCALRSMLCLASPVQSTHPSIHPPIHPSIHPCG
jgi:hypothetical protein